jgi:glycosyltransferase involved in cell wall biosynthesis
LRILMMNHEFTITGASTAFFRLAVHLRDQGHEPVIFPLNPENGPMQGRYAAQNIAVSTTQDLNSFDLCIGNTICAAPAIIQYCKHLRTIWIVHEAEIGLGILLKSPELAKAFAIAQAIVYQTPFQNDVYRSFTYHLDPGKFYTTPLGVDVDETIIARDKIPAKARRFRAVQVGTVEPRKRPGDFIKAVARSGLDIEGIIAGKHVGLAEDALEIVRSEPQTFRLLEGLSDGEVLGWVESADMFCLASSSETQGLSVYEAASLARPLLLSDLPCYRDIFTHGRNCLMFPSGNVEMLAASMRMLAVNPALRQTLGYEAQRTARRYTNAAFFARFDPIVNAVVQGA